MNTKQFIRGVEKEIDAKFASSSLKDVGYAQAMWTLLAVNEDDYLAHLNRLSDGDMHLYADGCMNALTYPLRVCFEQVTENAETVRFELIDRDYGLAREWLNAAVDYDQFCSMFPMWHRGRLDIIIVDNRLVVQNASNANKQAEAYNRIVRKEARPDPPAIGADQALVDAILSSTTIGTDWFRVNFNPQLVARIMEFLGPAMDARHTLPNEWTFNSFSLQQYRRIFLAIQSLMYAWHVARIVMANSGMPALGYKSCVWVVPRQELSARLQRYSGVHRGVVERVIDLLTFGAQVDSPDIATQPLVDLRNGTYALSPFVWLNTNMERNLCVLLNQIPAEKDRYSILSNEKEAVTRREIIEALVSLGYDFRTGEVKGTNLDLAVIDRVNRACLCLELKWFIEPAEIREIEHRTNELAKGVQQCKVINNLFGQHDERLIKSVLGIESDYLFLSAVGSVNWIGFGDVQDSDVPIIKVMHLVNKIVESGSLAEAINWLKVRDFLPKEGRDYSIMPMEVSCGEWSATWYCLKPLGDEDDGFENSPISD
jgi:hypothetical protein